MRHHFIFTGDVKVFMYGVESFAEQVINVAAKHGVLVLKSHELPCLRFYSATLSKVISSQPLEVAATVAAGGTLE